MQTFYYCRRNFNKIDFIKNQYLAYKEGLLVEQIWRKTIAEHCVIACSLGFLSKNGPHEEKITESIVRLEMYAICINSEMCFIIKRR